MNIGCGHMYDQRIAVIIGGEVFLYALDAFVAVNPFLRMRQRGADTAAVNCGNFRFRSFSFSGTWARHQRSQYGIEHSTVGP